jgi:hypothetical protein
MINKCITQNILFNYVSEYAIDFPVVTFDGFEKNTDAKRANPEGNAHAQYIKCWIYRIGGWHLQG